MTQAILINLFTPLLRIQNNEEKTPDDKPRFKNSGEINVDEAEATFDQRSEHKGDLVRRMCPSLQGVRPVRPSD